MPGVRPSRAMLQALRGKERILVLTHDNPDPDAIAVGLGLQTLLANRLGERPILGFGGIIGHAENKALVETLKVELYHAGEIDFGAFDAIALVDTQPGAGNHSLPEGSVPTVVIDHHPLRRADGIPFVDVRPGYGACSSILVEYLRTMKVAVDARLATALYYGIKVDTQDLGRHASPADIEAYRYLSPLVDRLILPRIEYPSLPREYFETFHTALERASVYGGAVICPMEEVESPNAVAEVADLLLRLEGTAWSLCLGFYYDQLFLSARTTDPEANAHEVIRRSLGYLGSGGGHGMLAGGRVPLSGLGRDERRRLRDTVAARFLAVLGLGTVAPVPLLETAGWSRSATGFTRFSRER